MFLISFCFHPSDFSFLYCQSNEVKEDRADSNKDCATNNLCEPEQGIGNSTVPLETDSTGVASLSLSCAHSASLGHMIKANAHGCSTAIPLIHSVEENLRGSFF